MIEELSPRAARVYEICCREISAGKFDSRIVERFLVYGRFLFNKNGWLREFANTAVHSVRNQGKTFKAVVAIRGLSEDALHNATINKPVGEVGVHLDVLERELSEALALAECAPIRGCQVEDFALCLILLCGQMEFEKECEGQLADVMILKNQIALIVGSEGFLYIGFLCVPNRYLSLRGEKCLIILGDCLAEAIRDEDGQLKIAFRSSPWYATGDASIVVSDK